MTEDKNWVHRLFSQECVFLKSVPRIEDLPEFSLPEVAFAGRSNVGKSSLLNALMHQGKLARTSNTPGRTQFLNFFQLKDQPILVDMPGYGYAEAPKTLVAQWQVLIRHYLKARPTLQRTYLLIDSRHGLKRNDLEMMDMLDKTASSYQIVLTKIDKISKTALESLEKTITKDLTKHPAAHPNVLSTSSEKKIGIEILQEEIAFFCQGYKPHLQ
jgi:GTP-binding protein